MLFLFFSFLFIGIVLYLNGISIRKNPYSLITNSISLSKKKFAPEAVKLYADKISKAQRMAGIFYIAFAFIHYFVESPDFSFAGLFITITIVAVYPYYCRKILVGKPSVVKIILISLLFNLPVVFVGLSYGETSITVDNEKINMRGPYGEEIPLNKLHKIYLADTLPNIGIRTNGISTGTINKGYFHSKSLRRNVKLLLHTNTKPYIYIVTTDKKYIIVNFKTKEKILRIYEQLRNLTVYE